MPRVLVLGAGGHARVVADVARASGAEVVGFLDDDQAKDGWVADLGGGRVLGTVESLFTIPGRSRSGLPFGATALALGIGDNRVRSDLLGRIGPHQSLPAFRHPAASVSSYAQIANGTVLVAGAVVNAGAEVGPGSIINTGATVGHDCVLGHSVHVAPGANIGGEAEIGDRAWIGIGSAIIQCIRIGSDATVGAGAVVVRDVPDGATVVGNPARRAR